MPVADPKKGPALEHHPGNVLLAGRDRGDDLVLDQIGRLPSAVWASRGAHVDTAAARASGAAAQLTLRVVSWWAMRGGGAGAVQRGEVNPIVPSASDRAQLSPLGVDIEPKAWPCRGLGQSLCQRRDPPQTGAPAQSARHLSNLVGRAHFEAPGQHAAHILLPAVRAVRVVGALQHRTPRRRHPCVLRQLHRANKERIGALPPRREPERISVERNGASHADLRPARSAPPPAIPNAVRPEIRRTAPP